jgi:RNA recognition motif-containing protein
LPSSRWRCPQGRSQDAFAAHGVVTEANLMTDRTTGRPRGFAFVTMATPEEAQKAIEAMNGATLDGRNLTVNEARPREERSGGGFRGGNDRDGDGGSSERRRGGPRGADHFRGE